MTGTPTKGKRAEEKMGSNGGETVDIHKAKAGGGGGRRTIKATAVKKRKQTGLKNSRLWVAGN